MMLWAQVSKAASKIALGCREGEGWAEGTDVLESDAC